MSVNKYGGYIGWSHEVCFYGLFSSIPSISENRSILLTHTMNLIIIKSNQNMYNLHLLCVKRLAHQTTLQLGHSAKQ